MNKQLILHTLVVMMFCSCGGGLKEIIPEESAASYVLNLREMKSSKNLQEKLVATAQKNSHRFELVEIPDREYQYGVRNPDIPGFDFNVWLKDSILLEIDVNRSNGTEDIRYISFYFSDPVGRCLLQDLYSRDSFKKCSSEFRALAVADSSWRELASTAIANLNSGFILDTLLYEEVMSTHLFIPESKDGWSEQLIVTELLGKDANCSIESRVYSVLHENESVHSHLSIEISFPKEHQ